MGLKWTAYHRELHFRRLIHFRSKFSENLSPLRVNKVDIAAFMEMSAVIDMSMTQCSALHFIIDDGIRCII